MLVFYGQEYVSYDTEAKLEGLWLQESNGHELERKHVKVSSQYLQPRKGQRKGRLTLGSIFPKAGRGEAITYAQRWCFISSRSQKNDLAVSC